MARQNLNGMTPDQVKAHKNEQARLRMEKMRDAQKKEREMAKKTEQLTPNSPEVVEFVDEILGLPLRARVPLMAEWQRHYKQKLPVEQVGLSPASGETYPEFAKRREKERDLMLTRFFADDYIARGKAADRKKAFNAQEAKEAEHLGITVFELQKRRKIAAAAEARKARAVERLAQKQAA